MNATQVRGDNNGEEKKYINIVQEEFCLDM